MSAFASRGAHKNHIGFATKLCTFMEKKKKCKLGIISSGIATQAVKQLGKEADRQAPSHGLTSKNLVMAVRSIYWARVRTRTRGRKSSVCL